MADRLMRMLFRPGWRLRCVDPPLAWVQLRSDQPPAIAIRLQLTCYLTSRRASAVWFKDSQLRLHVGERSYIVPMEMATQTDGAPFDKDSGFDVYHDEPNHALVDFVTDAPDVGAVFRDPGSPINVDVEALLNNGIEYRKIADLDLGRVQDVDAGYGWRRVSTGRESEDG